MKIKTFIASYVPCHIFTYTVGGLFIDLLITKKAIKEIQR